MRSAQKNGLALLCLCLTHGCVSQQSAERILSQALIEPATNAEHRDQLCRVSAAIVRQELDQWLKLPEQLEPEGSHSTDFDPETFFYKGDLINNSGRVDAPQSFSRHLRDAMIHAHVLTQATVDGMIAYLTQPRHHNQSASLFQFDETLVRDDSESWLRTRIRVVDRRGMPTPYEIDIFVGPSGTNASGSYANEARLLFATVSGPDSAVAPCFNIQASDPKQLGTAPDEFTPESCAERAAERGFGNQQPYGPLKYLGVEDASRAGNFVCTNQRLAKPGVTSEYMRPFVARDAHYGDLKIPQDWWINPAERTEEDQAEGCLYCYTNNALGSNPSGLWKLTFRVHDSAASEAQESVERTWITRATVANPYFENSLARIDGSRCNASLDETRGMQNLYSTCQDAGMLVRGLWWGLNDSRTDLMDLVILDASPPFGNSRVETAVIRAPSRSHPGQVTHVLTGGWTLGNGKKASVLGEQEIFKDITPGMPF